MEEKKHTHKSEPWQQRVVRKPQEFRRAARTQVDAPAPPARAVFPRSSTRPGATRAATTLPTRSLPHTRAAATLEAPSKTEKQTTKSQHNKLLFFFCKEIFSFLSFFLSLVVRVVLSSRSARRLIQVCRSSSNTLVNLQAILCRREEVARGIISLKNYI
jgi:hypothetical protein